MAIATINPATGERCKAFAAHTAAEVETRLARAAAAAHLLAATRERPTGHAWSPEPAPCSIAIATATPA